MECEASGKDTRSGIWEEVIEPLIPCLEAISTHPTRHVFGAIAIGRVVRFYELVNDRLAHIHGGSTAFISAARARPSRRNWSTFVTVTRVG